MRNLFDYIVALLPHRNGNFIFKIGVSQGKGKRIWSSDIETHHLQTGESGLTLISDARVFQNLKSLSNYYKFVYRLIM